MTDLHIVAIFIVVAVIAFGYLELMDRLGE
jgi:hypothetical protein